MSTTAELTEERVLEVLKTVRFPGLSRDIVSFGFVKDLAVGGGNVSMRLEIMTESEGAAEEIKRDATEKLRSLPGVSAVTIRLDRKAPAPAAPRGLTGPPPGQAEILQDVRRVASGLLASGAKPGDRIAIFGATNLQWVICDLAVTAIHGVTVPIYGSNTPEECRYILNNRRHQTSINQWLNWIACYSILKSQYISIDTVYCITG